MHKRSETLADVGSERAVISGVCQYGMEGYIDVSEIITSSTFTVENNQLLFMCLEKILEETHNIDVTGIVTTATRLGIYDKLFSDKRDAEFIRSVFNFPIKRENIRNYAKRLAKLEFARRAQSVVKDIYDRLGEVTGDETIDNIVSIPEDGIFNLIFDVNKGKEDGPILISDGGKELLEDLIANPAGIAGIPTPWPHYNTAIGGGIRRGGVNLIGARPKVGKSTLGKEMALHCALKLKIPILLLDTEMNKNDQLFRSLSSISSIPTSRIESGEFGTSEAEKETILQTLQQLEDSPFFYYKDVFGKPFPEVLSIIRRWIVQTVGYDEYGNTNDCLIIYDYFKLMDESQLHKIQEYQAIGFQLSKLTDFTKQYDFPCLAFVQLNREEGISQSDRLIWFAHSFSKYKKKTVEEMAEDGKENGNRKLTVDETRFGPGLVDDYIDMDLIGEISKIEEIGLHSDADKRKAKKMKQFASSNDELAEIIGEGAEL